MRDLLIVGSGSFLGGISRYYISSLILHSYATHRFPLGTFVVNFIGCFLMGSLSGLAEHLHLFSPQARLFLMTGVLGGFTTFSAFGYETIYLARTNNLNFAVLNVFLSIICCLFAVWVGLKISRAF